MPNEANEHSGSRAGSPNSRNRAAIIAGAVVVALGAAYVLFGRGGEGILPGTTFIAKRGDLDITVTEGGSIEALESQEIRSRIKGHQGVKILTLIEEGYLVTPEDVEEGLILVKLDSADLEERQVNQEIAVQSARAQFIERRAQYDIQVNQNQSNISAAELQAKFALMDFEKFLGKKAVDSIIGKLSLDERAAELVKMKAKGVIIEEPPVAAPAANTFLTTGLGEGPVWGSGPSTDRSRPPRGMSRGGGGARPQGRPQFGGQRGGSGGARGGFGADWGGMADASERFKSMIEANGGKIPEGMADRLREMGMDPDTIMQQMGGAPPAETDPSKMVQELKDSSSDIDVKTAFTNEPAYIAARAAIDFASYADVNELEDGEAKKMLRQLQDESLLEKESRSLAETQLQGFERLADAGHLTANELENERLSVQRQRIREELAEMSRHLYIQYTFTMDAERLLSDYEEALMNLERTMHEAGAQMAQAEVGFTSAERKFNLESRQLRDFEEQIEMCTIRAERPGLVVYGSSAARNPWRGSNNEPTQEGATVRQRQVIITIPDMTKMGVTVDIHEAAVRKVAKGQTVTMYIEAFRDRTLTGDVVRVAVLADSANMFMNPDLKVYPTTVRIDGVHDWLRPGMSAEVSILIDTLEDVVYIPIQSVSYFGDAQVCWVVNNGRSERRIITTGSFTEDFIEVRSGLEEGEEVRLLPPGAGEQDDLLEDEGVEEGGEGAEPPAPEEVRVT